MTHIPGTSEPKAKANAPKKDFADEARVIGIYKKEVKIRKKITAKSPIWYLDHKYWIWLGLTLSLVSVILGFLIYRSFFILAIFIPLSLLAIRFVIKFFEDSISKFDPLSK